MGDWVGWGCLMICISLVSSVGLLYWNHDALFVEYLYRHFVLEAWFSSLESRGPAA